MLPFPCQSKVILAPFLSSPQWDAPVSLMQAEMLPNTAVGRGASGEGSTAPAQVYPWDSRTLGDRLSTAGPALELSVRPAKGDGMELWSTWRVARARREPRARPHGCCRQP